MVARTTTETFREDASFDYPERTSSSTHNSYQPILGQSRGMANLGPPHLSFLPNRQDPTSSSSGTLYYNRLVPASPTRSRDISREASPAPAPGDRPLSSADSNASLAVNYLPSKFSSGMLSDAAGTRRRPRRRRNADGMGGFMPKMGGGVDAFRTGELRIGGHEDEDDSPTSSRQWLQNPKGNSGKALRWNKFKWVLLISNLTLTIYSIVGLVFCLLTWFNTFKHADILRVGNKPELVVSTLACSLGILTSLIGWAGILLNNRSFLALYTFLLWIVFACILIPGYLTYKRHTFNLEGKINAQWSQSLGAIGRLRIQNELSCCGYFSPFVEATISQICYARSILPGCKAAYIAFEKVALRRWYTVAFVLVPFHLAVMVSGLLCSNHVTYRFGKGMMPKAYRLSMTSMAIIMENYANQLAEQYGSDMASEILTRSRSNLQLDALPSVLFEKAPVMMAVRTQTGGTSSTKATLVGTGTSMMKTMKVEASGAQYSSLGARMPSDSGASPPR